MNILTLDNKCFNLNNLPEEIEEDIRFSVLDNSNTNDPDFFFLPLIFLESFNSPAIELEIDNQHKLVMPLDWCILVGDPSAGNDLEILPLTSINDRSFEAFAFNPISSYTHKFFHISITNIYNDVKWYFPKTKNAQLISTPIVDQDDSLCIFFIKEISRQSETLQLHNLL